jgi:hypothetical protein
MLISLLRTSLGWKGTFYYAMLSAMPKGIWKFQVLFLLLVRVLIQVRVEVMTDIGGTPDLV